LGVAEKVSAHRPVFFFKMRRHRPSGDAPAPDFVFGYSDDIRTTTTAIVAHNIQVMRPEYRVVDGCPRLENGSRNLGTHSFDREKFADFIFEAIPPAWFKPSSP
jgi:hypothetical protein